ncbi:hypothetical protein [Sinorhizobium medicae]
MAAEELLKRMSLALDDLSPDDTIGFTNGVRWVDVATVAEIRAASDARAECETCNGTGKEGRNSLCRDCDEPVAWRSRWEDPHQYNKLTDWHYREKEPHPNAIGRHWGGWETQPLYLRSAAGADGMHARGEV